MQRACKGAHRAITRDLVERALELPSDEDEALFALAPLAASMTEPHARRHLGAPRPARSVFGELQAAYEKALAHRAR
ncbi:hypothetical protein [Sorangium sp. So ce1151]|uniref:hypothetical protein n=1 Tax=Sorangium sp. So ce1151 TaxID=3133332 RepID=UPI003F5ED419